MPLFMCLVCGKRGNWWDGSLPRPTTCSNACEEIEDGHEEPAQAGVTEESR